MYNKTDEVQCVIVYYKFIVVCSLILWFGSLQGTDLTSVDGHRPTVGVVLRLIQTEVHTAEH